MRGFVQCNGGQPAAPLRATWALHCPPPSPLPLLPAYIYSLDAYHERALHVAVRGKKGRPSSPAWGRPRGFGRPLVSFLADCTVDNPSSRQTAQCLVRPLAMSCAGTYVSSAGARRGAGLAVSDSSRCARAIRACSMPPGRLRPVITDAVLKKLRKFDWVSSRIVCSS